MGISFAIVNFTSNILISSLELIQYNEVNLPLPDSWNLYFVGIAFFLGVIFAQFLPSKTGLQLIYIVGWGTFIFVFRETVRYFGILTFTHFNSFLHYQVSIQLMIALALIKNYFAESKLKEFP